MPKKVGENEMDIFKIFKGKKNTKEPIPEKEPQRIYSNLEQNLTLRDLFVLKQVKDWKKEKKTLQKKLQNKWDSNCSL